MNKATQFIRNDVKEAARLLTDPLSIGYFESRHMLEHNRYTMSMNSIFRIGLYSIRELLYDANVISRLPDEHELYTSKLLTQIDPTLVKIGAEHQKDMEIEQSDNVYTLQGVVISRDATCPLSFLLVDDSNVIRKILKDVIAALNGELSGEATTGREAISQYKTLAPDIVIMDLSMPDMTGIDAIAGILHFDPDANIIVLSGSNFPETRQEVFDLGAKMFISKPFDVERMTTAIQTLLTV